MTNVEINTEEEVLGRDTSTQFLLAFIYIMTLYSVILMFGSIVATAVAREKDSRTMELLITTTNPKNLIIGKVLAITCASVMQMLVIASSAGISYFIFRNMYPMDILMMTKKMLDLSMLGMYVFYFILGLLLYYVYLCGFRICSISNGRCKQCGKSSYIPVCSQLYDCDVCFTRWRFNYSEDFFMDSILLGYGNADT